MKGQSHFTYITSKDWSMLFAQGINKTMKVIAINQVPWHSNLFTEYLATDNY